MRTLPNDPLGLPADAPEEARGTKGDRSDPVRRCILTGDRASPDHFVRLALSPDGELFPDVNAKAPGRGAWIGVTRTELETAIAKGKLKGALARAFKGETVRFADDLPARIEALLKAATMDRLGLEARGGMLIAGSEKIENAARSGQVTLLLHACDAGTDGNRKLDQAWRVGMDEEGSGRLGLVLPVDREALSMALGRQNAVHIALTDAKAAARLMRHLGRWLNFCGCSNATGPAKPDSVDGVAADAADDKLIDENLG